MASKTLTFQNLIVDISPVVVKLKWPKKTHLVLINLSTLTLSVSYTYREQTYRKDKKFTSFVIPPQKFEYRPRDFNTGATTTSSVLKAIDFKVPEFVRKTSPSSCHTLKRKVDL